MRKQLRAVSFELRAGDPFDGGNHNNVVIFEKFKRKDRGDREVAQRRAESIEALCESLRPLRPLRLKR